MKLLQTAFLSHKTLEHKQPWTLTKHWNDVRVHEEHMIGGMIHVIEIELFTLGREQQHNVTLFAVTGRPCFERWFLEDSIFENLSKM